MHVLEDSSLVGCDLVHAIHSSGCNTQSHNYVNKDSTVQQCLYTIMVNRSEADSGKHRRYVAPGLTTSVCQSQLHGCSP